MSGRVGDLSPKQAQSLCKFKEIFKNELQQHHDDHFLLRWLRARDFDLKASEEMLRNDFAWRKRMGADTILENFQVPAVAKKYLTGGHCGFDKDGASIWIEPFGRIDLKGLLRSCPKSDILKTAVYRLESLSRANQEQSVKYGKRIDQLIIIYDLEGLGMHHLWKPGVDCFCEMVDMVEKHYPETLKWTFVINAPKFFPIAYNIVKPFLSKETASKVRIFGYNNYKEVLLQYIDADQLPERYGGSMSKEKSHELICFGGPVPKDCYLTPNKVDYSKYTKVNVGRGSSVQLDYTISVPNSAIRWQFLTENYDIGFGLHKRTKDSRQKASKMEECIQSERVNCHIIPEDGSYTCRETGTYVVRFDNTYSWARSKNVYYIIEVLEPDTEDEFPSSMSDHEGRFSDNGEEEEKNEEKKVN